LNLVFEVQAWICRFYGLPPAGLSADEWRSHCRLANEVRQGEADTVKSWPAGGNAGATPGQTAKSDPLSRPEAP